MKYMNNTNTEVQKVRQYLINTQFFIKEQRNNFTSGSIISISAKVEGTNTKSQMIMFNEKDFTVDNLKAKIDEALITNEPTVRHFEQAYYELNEVLSPLYRDLTIDEVLEN